MSRFRLFSTAAMAALRLQKYRVPLWLVIIYLAPNSLKSVFMAWVVWVVGRGSGGGRPPPDWVICFSPNPKTLARSSLRISPEALPHPVSSSSYCLGRNEQHDPNQIGGGFSVLDYPDTLRVF